MNYEDLQKAEELKWKRVYDYTCLFCQKKRKARKFAIAKSRMCSSCKKAKIAEAFNKRQGSLFS